MKRKSIKVEKVLPYSILTVIGVLFLLPLLWVVVASVDPNANSSIKVPSAFTMDNFKSVITDPVNIRAFIIGLLLSMGQGLLVVLVAGLAAYPLSRYQLRYKKPFMFTILFMTSLPITAVMVPVYQLFIYMKLQDSLWGTMFF